MRQWLKQIRKKKKMTHGDVSKECGFSRTLYTLVENGLRRPSVENAKRIASVLGFDWTRFYEDESPNDSHEHEKEAI